MAYNLSYPPLHKIKARAWQLKNTLSIQYCQALELVAYFYDCHDWHELLGAAGGNRQIKRPGVIAADHNYAKLLRAQLMDVFNSSYGDDFRKDNRLINLPQKISHALFYNNIKWLLDEEVMRVYSAIFEDETEKPMYSVLEGLQGFDDNIVNRIINDGNGFKSGHLEDFKFGFRVYYQWDIKGDDVKLVLRELNSMFYPPRLTLAPSKVWEKRLFSAEWFAPHVLAFIEHLQACLQPFFSKRQIIIQYINNQSCLLEERKEGSKQLGYLPILEGILKARGGVEVELHPSTSGNRSPLCISIGF